MSMRIIVQNDRYHITMVDQQRQLVEWWTALNVSSMSKSDLIDGELLNRPDLSQTPSGSLARGWDRYRW